MPDRYLSVAAGLAGATLEAILIGNAAAAVHGAPVTTGDFDFMFRETTLNLTKLKRFSTALSAYILRPLLSDVEALPRR